jgi:hypothetical protein
MLDDQEAKDYAKKLILRATQAESIDWDVIAESWDGPEELTREELNQVYSLIFDAKVDISWG